MDQTVTVKAKLLNIDEETAHSFMQTMVKYKDACNFISQYVFNHAFELKQSKLNKALYRDLALPMPRLPLIKCAGRLAVVCLSASPCLAIRFICR